MRKILNYNDLGDNTAVFDLLRPESCSDKLHMLPLGNALSSTLMGTPHKNTDMDLQSSWYICTHAILLSYPLLPAPFSLDTFLFRYTSFEVLFFLDTSLLRTFAVQITLLLPGPDVVVVFGHQLHHAL